MNFCANKDESKLISKIAARAVQMAKEQGADYDHMPAMMDVEACHCNGMPLKLQELLDADNFNFSHDVFGIANHINRETGKIERFFVPRFYDSKAKAA